MNNEICENCQFFKQHYSLDGNFISQLHFGTCRKNEKIVESKAVKENCKYFIPSATADFQKEKRQNIEDLLQDIEHKLTILRVLIDSKPLI